MLAEWTDGELHVHCHINGEGCWWLAPATLRNFIFCRELPLVSGRSLSLTRAGL